ncbi:MAG: PIN domain-containing protein [Albidovulum sp.]|nr:PIN domain-containing protein [Albidovulum sp.]
MRAIVDANVVSIVFGAGKNKPNNRPDAAREFLKHISSDGPVLVIGGRLKEELFKLERFRIWYDEASKSGRVRNVSDADVAKEEAKLDSSAGCQSNDRHVLALARISGARLLYTNDQKLMNDFKNTNLVPTPKGKVYRTPRNGKFTEGHKMLLQNSSCKAG